MSASRFVSFEELRAILNSFSLGGSDASLSYEAVSNESGNVTLEPEAKQHNARVNVTGSAGTRVFVLPSSEASAGDRVEINFVLPDTADIVIEIRDGAADGTLIYSRTTTATEATDGYRLRAIMEYDGSVWQPVQAIYPAI